MKEILAIIAILSSFVVNSFNKYILHPLSSPTSTTANQYLVTINNTPTLDGNGDFLFNASVKNISVKPFISKISFTTCTFSNDLGTREASGDEKDFEKALLPGEETRIDFRFIEMWNYCIYDNAGNKVCRDAKDFELKSCRVAVSNGSGDAKDLPTTVNFP